MRRDPADDLLDARLREETPVRRAERRGRERRDAYGRAWTAAVRHGARTDAEIGTFILERLYPDLPASVIDAYRAAVEARSADGEPVIARPGP